MMWESKITTTDMKDNQTYIIYLPPETKRLVKEFQDFFENFISQSLKDVNSFKNSSPASILKVLGPCFNFTYHVSQNTNYQYHCLARFAFATDRKAISQLIMFHNENETNLTKEERGYLQDIICTCLSLYFEVVVRQKKIENIEKAKEYLQYYNEIPDKSRYSLMHFGVLQYILTDPQIFDYFVDKHFFLHFDNIYSSSEFTTLVEPVTGMSKIGACVDKIKTRPDAETILNYFIKKLDEIMKKEQEIDMLTKTTVNEANVNSVYRRKLDEEISFLREKSLMTIVIITQFEPSDTLDDLIWNAFFNPGWMFMRKIGHSHFSDWLKKRVTDPQVRLKMLQRLTARKIDYENYDYAPIYTLMKSVLDERCHAQFKLREARKFNSTVARFPITEAFAHSCFSVISIVLVSDVSVLPIASSYFHDLMQFQIKTSCPLTEAMFDTISRLDESASLTVASASDFTDHHSLGNYASNGYCQSLTAMI